MRRILAIVAIVVGVVSSAIAAVPTSITVQGRLTDASGVPLSAGIKEFTFRIFDASLGGSEIWPGGAGETQFIVSDNSGLWSGRVGAAISLTESVFTDTVRWLEVTVTDGVFPDVTLPRIRLVTGPYAFRVATVDGASGRNITTKV